MSKTMTLSLGGKDRTLDFGKWYFAKFYGQATGSDPLNASEILLKPESQFNFVVNIVYAGMQTEYKVNKRAFDFTKEEVEDWLGCMEETDVAKIIIDYTNLSKPNESGEVLAPENGA
jgi:hypothetical protein